MDNKFTEKEGTHKTSWRTSVLVKFIVLLCDTGIYSPLPNPNKIGLMQVILDRYDVELTMWSVAPESGTQAY